MLIKCSKMCLIIQYFIQIYTLFFELCGIQAQITDFVGYVFSADPISLISCWKIHLIF